MADLFVGAVLGGALLWTLLTIRNRLSGTTLIAPHTWGILSATAVTACTVSRGDIPENSIAYLAAISTCLPTVALLGAKKPQNVAWQWIVAGLWIILSIPGFNAIIHGQGIVEIGSIWGSLLVVLIFLPVGNYWATRYRLSALLFAFAQAVLFIECGILQIGQVQQATEAAISVRLDTLSIAVALVAMLLARSAPHRHAIRTTVPLARAWYEFSELYGILWSKRVGDRVAQLSATSEPHAALHPDQWISHPAAASETGEMPTEMEGTLRNLLLRFVSSKWIDRVSSDAGSTAARTGERPN